MLIRSQSKEDIINFNQVSMIRIIKDGYDYEIYLITVNNSLIPVGKYASEERCKDILTDICECYKSFVMFPGADGNAVFQMPEE